MFSLIYGICWQNIFFYHNEKKLPHKWWSPYSVFLILVDIYFTKLLSLFSCGYRNPVLGRIVKISFSMILLIFRYKKTIQISKKDIFKIRLMVWFRYSQLKNNNSFMEYIQTKTKSTEQGLHQFGGSFFSLWSKNILP